MDDNNNFYMHQSQTDLPKPKKGLTSKAKQGLIVLLVMVGVLLIGVIVSTINAGVSSMDVTTTLPKLTPFSFKPNSILNISLHSPKNKVALNHSHIAVLYIEGTIQAANESYNQDWLLDTINDLGQNPQNKGLILYIDSPGGTIYHSDELYLALRDYTEYYFKPLWAYMGPLAASGGYYIACAADTIYANRNTLTGSIGVIGSSSFNIKGLLDKYGIQVTTITSGKNKAMGSMTQPLTQEQISILQSLSDEAYEQFVGIVAARRNLPLKTVKVLADGRIYSAKQAQDNKLIDYIDSLDNAIATIKDAFEVDIDVEYLHYEPTKTFKDYLWKGLSGLSARQQPLNLQGIKAELGIPSNLTFPAYYYQSVF